MALCDSLKHRLLWISAAFQGRKTDLTEGLNLLLTLILFETFEHLNFGFVSDFEFPGIPIWFRLRRVRNAELGT